MARKWIPASQNSAELDRQLAAAVEAGRAAAQAEPRALSARYHTSAARVEVELRGGLTFGFPASHYAELSALSPEQLAGVRVTASGYGLHWDDSDVHLAVPQIVTDLFGAWTAQTTGREGGKSRSPAKQEAARRNALQGGRPSRQIRTRLTRDGIHVETTAGSVHRSMNVDVGLDYIVEPLNPAAHRNRGRIVRVLAIQNVETGRIKVQFHDTGRTGTMEAHDLLPLEEEQISAA